MQLNNAINQLGSVFKDQVNAFPEYHTDGHHYLMNSWPGDPDEDVMVCIYKGNDIHEPYHRQDFFFFNYAYENSYATQSDAQGTMTPIREGEGYIGQPYNGYALRATEKEDVTIIGILIQRQAFIRDYLQTIATDHSLFQFFLEPQTDHYADHFIHLDLHAVPAVRTLLELMVIEYAHKKEDTQAVLKPMVLSLFMLLARQYRESKPVPAEETPAQQILRYLREHTDITSLKQIAAHFAYHPNYISTLIRKETGKTFSQILLETRMERATILLRNTNLSVEEIAYMLGYSNPSNFYKAFRSVYHASPRSVIDRARALPSI